MRGEVRLVTIARAYGRAIAAAATLLAARPGFPLLGPAPVAGGTALDMGGPPPAARR